MGATYNNIGKGISVDGTLMQNFYGIDFNPDPFPFPGWESVSAYQATTSFNLSGFQPGHEVGCGVLSFTVDGWTGTLWGDFYRDGEYGWSTSRYIDDASANEWCVYIYFGVDKDEIRPGYSEYQIHYYSADGVKDFWSPTFRVTNLSIDSSYHPAGYLWVDGTHLCYTDNTGDEAGRNGYGFKHKIAYDSGYSSSVGSSYAGSIWLDEGDNLRIYYVDENGTKRRTYNSDVRYGGNVNVGSSNKGYMWVGVAYAEYGYGYLCFIAPNGSKRRILNGPPAGYS